MHCSGVPSFRVFPNNMDPSLTSVEMVGHASSYLQARFFAPMRKLERLVLRDLGLSIIQDFSLLLLPSLVHLDISGNQLAAGLRVASLPTSGKLEVLNLTRAAGNATLFVRPFAVKPALSPMCGRGAPAQVISTNDEPLCTAAPVKNPDNVTCWQYACSPSENAAARIPCPGGERGQLVLRSDICDGIVDCADGSDEDPALCAWDTNLIGLSSPSPECEQLFDGCVTPVVRVVRSAGIITLFQDFERLEELCVILHQAPTFRSLSLIPVRDTLYEFLYEGSLDTFGYNFTLEQSAFGAVPCDPNPGLLFQLEATFGTVCKYRFASEQRLSVVPCETNPAPAGGKSGSSLPVIAGAGGAAAVCVLGVVIMVLVLRHKRNRVRVQVQDEVCMGKRGVALLRVFYFFFKANSPCSSL